MNKQRALLVAIEPYLTQGSRLPWTVHLAPSVLGAIADHNGAGFRIVGVVAADSVGLDTDADVNAFGQAFCREMAAAAGVDVRAVAVLDSLTDPRPLWEAARRFDLDLKRSMLLTEGGVHAGVALTAGVGQALSMGEVASGWLAA